MAAPAHVFTIGRTAEILPRTSNYCGTSHSTWNRKTAASGSTKPTTNRRWRSRTAAWESLQELVSEHKRSRRPRGPQRPVTEHQVGGVAQGVDESMDFRGQSAARSADRLVAVFFWAPALC